MEQVRKGQSKKTHLRTLGPQLYPRGVRSFMGVTARTARRQDSKVWTGSRFHNQDMFVLLYLLLRQKSAFSLSEEPTTQIEYTVILLIHS